MDFLKKAPHGPDHRVKVDRHIDLRDNHGRDLQGESSEVPPGRWRSPVRSDATPRPRSHRSRSRQRDNHHRSRSRQRDDHVRSSPAVHVSTRSSGHRDGQHHSPSGSLGPSSPNGGGDRRRPSPPEMLPGATHLPLRQSPQAKPGLHGLQRMAAGSPLGPVPPRSDDFANFVLSRIKVDTAELTADNFVIDLSNRLPRPLAPSKALASMTKIKDPVYQAAYDIYLRKLNEILDRIPDRRSKLWHSVNKLCKSLNIELPKGPGSHRELAELLARLRANDMTKKSY
jgi:hypothetical protein